MGLGAGRNCPVSKICVSACRQCSGTAYVTFVLIFYQHPHDVQTALELQSFCICSRLARGCGVGCSGLILVSVLENVTAEGWAVLHSFWRQPYLVGRPHGWVRFSFKVIWGVRKSVQSKHYVFELKKSCVSDGSVLQFLVEGMHKIKFCVHV